MSDPSPGSQERPQLDPAAPSLSLSSTPFQGILGSPAKRVIDGAPFLAPAPQFLGFILLVQKGGCAFYPPQMMMLEDVLTGDR